MYSQGCEKNATFWGQEFSGEAFGLIGARQINPDRFEYT